MSWQQIIVNCPHCGRPTVTVCEFKHIRQMCQNPYCGGFYILTDNLDAAGLPIPAAAATPEETSLKAAGGWRGYLGLR